MSAETVRAVIAAAAIDGFEPRIGAKGFELRGDIPVAGRRVPLRLVFDDANFAEAPRALIPDASSLPRRVVPHLRADGDLCIVNRRFHVFDRYNAPAQVRGLIARAGEVLGRGLTASGVDEIAAEFPSYWAETSVDLPMSARNADPLPAEGRRRARAKAAPAAPAPVRVDTAATLSFRPDQDRPGTLGELLDWAATWDAGLPASILAALRPPDGADPSIAIHAPNGIAVVVVRVSARGTAWAGTLARPEAWRRHLASASARSLPIERFEGRWADAASLTAMNGSEGRAPLAGRRIALVGCGAIGGFLSRALAQSGAGFGGGGLALVDHERLDRDNPRRHVLGLGSQGEWKATACAELVGRDLPGCAVAARTARAQDETATLAATELVIDATGEQGLSEWLNAWVIARRSAGDAAPALLHVWIAGEGLAAQSFVSTEPGYACYRCLQPDHRQRPRLDPLAEVPEEPVAACGRAPVTRYGPAAPMSAAALAMSHACDWAQGSPHHLLRTVRIDWRRTVRRDPASPRPAAACPACQGG